jgi:protein-S-isoprenylcysteine O-methyltransferase Ste14
MTDDPTFRAILGLNVAIVLPIGIYHRLQAKRAAAGERLSRRDEGLFILIALRLGGLIAWVALLLYLIDPALLAWAAVPLPLWLRRAGAVVGLVVVPPLSFWVFRSLGTNLTDTVVTRRAHSLVTHGPYRWVRHPFYGVAFLMFLACSLMTANAFIALLSAFDMVLLVARTRIEERKLIERFGEEYRSYMRRTGRFFPRKKRSC